MSDNKLIVRRLPPSMNEEEFLKHVSPLPRHDYFCFFEANSGLGPHSFSRAYINFLDQGDMSIFRERFDNYIFLDKDGHEYPAVCEQSLWHKSPKNGPFFVKLGEESAIADGQKSSSATSEQAADIFSDSDFIEFMEKLEAQKRKPRQSPIQTLESNLDELTNATSGPSGANKDSAKVVTPLIGFVNKKRVMRNGGKRNR